MAVGRTRANAAPVGRVTKTEGVNRFIWDARHQSGLSAPPGAYRATIRVGGATETQPFNLLIDPNVAAEGTTVADLTEQFAHNIRMRQLVADAGQAVARLREAQSKMTGADADKVRQLEALAARLLTEPVRYGKPGLQAHITYLAGMTTRGDQKIGRDAVERYAVLRKDLDEVKAELDKVIGPLPQPAR
jgi:hypothetical protein